MLERLRGYVGELRNGPRGRTAPRVCVKDPASPLNGRWFTVASTHGGLELAKGLNVTFVIGTIDDENGQKVPRAVDVRLE